MAVRQMSTNIRKPDIFKFTPTLYKRFRCRGRARKCIHVVIIRLQILIVVDCKTVGFFFFSKSFLRSLRISHARRAPASHGLSPVLLAVFSLPSDLLFDCSRLLEYAKNTDCFAVYDGMEIWKCWFSRGKSEYVRKNLIEQGKNQHQTQPTYSVASRWGPAT